MSRTVGKAVEDAVAERLKTPIIATFIFSWILVNHSFVLEFMFESLENKVLLAKGLSFDLNTDVIFPIGVSLFYLLVVPALQLSLEQLVLHTLGEKRRDHDSKVSRNAVTSSKAYQQTLVDKELEEWAEQKKELKRKLVEIRAEEHRINEGNKQLREQVASLEANNQRTNKLVKEAIESLERPKLHFGSDYEDTRTREQVCNDVIEILERVYPMKKIIKALKDY
ncbi:hypothetical protein EDB14_1826 [Vibrio crassostreae]|uniref:hypothetical protein n=1 Tax=Vibrio crassostreae TaxID=246167 RepID=UPI000F50977C|nr:hypothetical protein [Vibrio crassostreae]RPF10734.1 hypothetical protein EDB14_1826 [Vibrio crassostreae]